MLSSGQTNYQGYIDHRKGKTYDDKPAPTWDELPADIKTAWEMGALAAIQQFKDGLTLEDINWMLHNWTLKGS